MDEEDLLLECCEDYLDDGNVPFWKLALLAWMFLCW